MGPKSRQANCLSSQSFRTYTPRDDSYFTVNDQARYGEVVSDEKKTPASDEVEPTEEMTQDDVEGDVVETMLEMAAIPFFVDKEELERAGSLTPTISEMAPEYEDYDDGDDDTIRLDDSIFDEENLTENEG